MTSVMTALEATIPFRFLSSGERAAIAVDLTERSFATDETVIRQGDETDDRVYIVAAGAVDTLDLIVDPPRLIGRITANHYFGERASLFGEARSLELRAAEPTVTYSMPGARFLQLVAQSRGFAQALGDILRDKQGIFAAFEQFLTTLQHGVAEGIISMRQLLPLYKALQPALHGASNDPSTIDFAALTYAIRRLPDNVTNTLTWFITDTVPDVYPAPAELFPFIGTNARPRAVYEMLPGKSMVVIRDGLSDLVDFVTCLCLYSVEAAKLRKRVAAAGVLGQLDDATLPITDAEQDSLRLVWPDAPAARLRDIAVHHEDFTLLIYKRLNNYNSRHSERWASQIAEGCSTLMGADPSSLPADVQVHVISSNTHSVTNSLSAFLNAQSEEIIRWAETSQHRDFGDGWHTPMDLVYSCARDWLQLHPDAAAERRQADESAGILRLAETAFTGIQVDLIDTSRLASAGPVDALLTPPSSSRRALIVNIDFAFGQQAEEIIGNLLALFARNLASVNVIGKAGALTGKRGDILVPTLFVEQTTETLHLLHEPAVEELEWLRREAPGIDVHVGPMLTVAGTLLQNRMMLNFYRHIWRCIGLEMEGSYYHRKMHESARLGVITDEVRLRYLYYVSDLPLDHTANLSGRMSALEGVPPLYAITRSILNGIFQQQRGE